MHDERRPAERADGRFEMLRLGVLAGRPPGAERPAGYSDFPAGRDPIERAAKLLAHMRRIGRSPIMTTAWPRECARRQRRAEFHPMNLPWAHARVMKSP